MNPITHQPVRIYHFTHVDNLSSIVNCGELRCNNLLLGSDADHIDIAHHHIQDRRNRTRVPCGPGGVLHDYVPFYFAPRSPMLFAIHKGNVQSYPEGQRPLVYLVTTIPAVRARELQFVFTDGHAVVGISEFYDDLGDLNRIDWNIMVARYWGETDEDRDTPRRRQAEFLIYRVCPWDIIKAVVVIDEEMQRRAIDIVSTSSHQPPVLIRPAWYYQ